MHTHAILLLGNSLSLLVERGKIHQRFSSRLGNDYIFSRYLDLDLQNACIFTHHVAAPKKTVLRLDRHQWLQLLQLSISVPGQPMK